MTAKWFSFRAMEWFRPSILSIGQKNQILQVFRGHLYIQEHSSCKREREKLQDSHFGEYLLQVLKRKSEDPSKFSAVQQEILKNQLLLLMISLKVTKRSNLFSD